MGDGAPCLKWMDQMCHTLHSFTAWLVLEGRATLLYLQTVTRPSQPSFSIRYSSSLTWPPSSHLPFAFHRTVTLMYGHALSVHLVPYLCTFRNVLRQWSEVVLVEVVRTCPYTVRTVRTPLPKCAQLSYHLFPSMLISSTLLLSTPQLNTPPQAWPCGTSQAWNADQSPSLKPQQGKPIWDKTFEEEKE